MLETRMQLRERLWIVPVSAGICTPFGCVSLRRIRLVVRLGGTCGNWALGLLPVADPLALLKYSVGARANIAHTAFVAGGVDKHLFIHWR